MHSYDNWMTTEQASRILRVSSNLLRIMARQHRIDAKRDGRRWMIRRSQQFNALLRGQHRAGCGCHVCIPVGARVRVGVWLTQEQRDVLDGLAIRHRVNRSEMVRTLIDSWEASL